MALENFLWEFGCKDEEWLKPKKNNHEPCDGVVQQEDVDMLRNVQVLLFVYNNIQFISYFHLMACHGAASEIIGPLKIQLDSIEGPFSSQCKKIRNDIGSKMVF